VVEREILNEGVSYLKAASLAGHLDAWETNMAFESMYFFRWNQHRNNLRKCLGNDLKPTIGQQYLSPKNGN